MEMSEHMPGKLESYMKIVKGNQIHAPISELIGMRFTFVEAGGATFELMVNQAHFNSLGTVQGGIFTIMADAAMGIAFGSLLNENDKFSTIELKINFLRPISEGKLKAIGKVVHRGKRTGMAECEIFSDDGEKSRLVAKATSSLIIF
jgi:uncharacterized protein (TIGR00369 family)